MKRINSIFEAVTIIVIACTVLDICNIYQGFFFKLGVIVILVFIGYVLKEILNILNKKEKRESYESNK